MSRWWHLQTTPERQWGFVPFTQAEIDHAPKAFAAVIRARHRGVHGGRREAVAFIVALTTSTRRSRTLVHMAAGADHLSKLLCGLKIAVVGSKRFPLMGVKISS